MVKYATDEVSDERAMRQELEDALSEQILSTTVGKVYLNTLGDNKNVLASPFMVREILKGNLSTGELEDTIVANFDAGAVGYLYELGRNIIDPEYLLSNGILGIEGTKNVVTDLYEDYQKAGSFGAFAKNGLIETGKNLLNAGSAFWSGEYDAQIARGAGATTLEGILSCIAVKSVGRCTVNTKKNNIGLDDAKVNVGGNIKSGSMEMNLQFFADGSSTRSSVFRKPINLPSAKKVKIDMDEVLSGHTSSGKRAQQSQIKDLFPDRMDAKDIEREIREAYSNAKQVGGAQFDGVDTRIKLQGNGQNGVVEMWYNKSSKTIETAYPVYGKKVKID